MKATLNQIPINYVDSGPGQGLPVVLIHGMALDHQMWLPQIQALETGFRVVASDLRGHGRSGAGDGQFTYRQLAEDVLGLLDLLEIDKAVLCGLSMGGAVCMRIFELHPERVLALVLCDTTCDPDTEESKKRRELAIKSIKKEGLAPFADLFLKSVFAPSSFKKHKDSVEGMRDTILSSSPLGICGALLAQAARTDICPILQEINVPVLLMAGADDSLTPPGMMKKMAGSIPGARFKEISNAAHMANLENVEEFNRELLAFLGGLRSMPV